MMEILGQEEEEKWKESGGDGVKETGADMLSPGVLRVLLIHNSPPWQTFIHILTPHGCAQWSSRPCTSPCLSMDTPCGATFTDAASFSLLREFGSSDKKPSLCFCPLLLFRHPHFFNWEL